MPPSACRRQVQRANSYSPAIGTATEKGAIFLKTARTIADKAITALLTAAAVLGGASALLATFNAISRKFLSVSFPWVEELCTYLVVIAVFISIPNLELKDKQLCVDFLGSTIKKKAVQKGLYLFRGVVIIFLCVVVARYGLASTVTAWQTNTVTYVLQWPRAIFFGIGVAGFLAAIVSWVAAIFLNKGEKFS